MTERSGGAGMADDAARIAQLEAELAQRDAELRGARDENAALRSEGERRDRALAETVEQQTALGDVLRIIASAPADLQTVLDAVVQSASRLIDADRVSILRVEGQSLRNMACTDPNYDFGSVQPLDRGAVHGRAALDGITLHVYDPEAEHLAKYPKSVGIREGFQTALVTPLRTGGVSIGTLGVRRRERRPFSNAEITLLETFADQAVIAIENAR